MDIDDQALKRGNWAAAGVSLEFLKSCWNTRATHKKDLTVRSNQRNNSSSLLRDLGPSDALLKPCKEQKCSSSRLMKGGG